MPFDLRQVYFEEHALFHVRINFIEVGRTAALAVGRVFNEWQPEVQELLDRIDASEGLEDFAPAALDFLFADEDHEALAPACAAVVRHVHRDGIDLFERFYFFLVLHVLLDVQFMLEGVEGVLPVLRQAHIVNALLLKY